MKILLTADLHVHNWGQYSEYDEVGVPSRLRLYETMFSDIAELSVKHGVDHVILAGDLLQTHSPKPMVANVISDGLARLATEDTQVHVIPGNHDVDQKSGRFDVIHSGLRPLIPAGVHYYAEPATVYLLGSSARPDYCAYFYPWLHAAPDYAAMPAADLFVGHGMVQGSVDPFGHKFSNGYDPAQLAARFELSVIGDIHEAQVIAPVGATGRVLVPGQPIQVNHSSGVNTGVWLYDTDARELRHILTPEFPHAAGYHRFLTLDEPPPLPLPPTTHARVRRSAELQQVAADNVVDETPAVDLLAEARAVWSALARDDNDAGLAMLDDAYAKATTAAPAATIPAALTVTSLSIRDFYSVAALDVDFARLTGDVLVAGPNGSGKSSLPEAFYWCITGKNTRGSSIAELSNNVTGRPAAVTSTLAGGANTYVITRSRDPAHLLHLYVNGSDVTKASATETQEMIYQLLGLSGPEDVLALAYYSCVDPRNFTDCTPAQQFELLGRLVDSDRYDALAAEIRTRSDSANTAKATAVGAAGALATRCQQLQARLTEIESQRVADTRTVDILAEASRVFTECAGCSAAAAADRLRARVGQLQAMVDEAAPVDRASADSELRAIVARERSLATQIAGVQSRIADITAALGVAAVERRCPTCRQALPESDHSVRDGYKAQLRQLGDEYRQLLGSQGDPNVATQLQAKIEAAQTRMQANEALQAQIRQASAYLTLLSGASNTELDQRHRVLEEELVSARSQWRDADSKAQVAEAQAKLLAAMQLKLFSKNSRLMMQLTASAFTGLCARINTMIGDPDLAQIEPVIGKTLDCAMSFGGNKPVRIGGMSAGQRRLLDVLMMLALAEAFARRSHNPAGLFGLAFYDEVVTYLDPAYLEIVQQAIASTAVRTRVMITHDEALASYFHQIIRVTRANGLSHYEAVGVDGAITEELPCA